MITVKKHGVVLEKTNLAFENEGVLNPGVILFENKIHLFYRAVHKGNYSSIGYCVLDAPLSVLYRGQKPLLIPENSYESKGLEDPRVVCIDNTFYMSYTAYDGTNALGAIATSIDLKNWNKQGVIVPQITYREFKALTENSGPLNDKYLIYNEHNRQYEYSDTKKLVWDKNVIFFPERIGGKLCFFHRIKPDIQVVLFIDALTDLTKTFWKNYLLSFSEHIVLAPKYTHEMSYIGGGCPPVKTEDGWLIIYHGVHDSASGYIYSACAALLDLKNPKIEIARLPYPLFFPEFPWELKGEVNNVCFPTGAIDIKGELYIYYGAADERIACASVNIKSLIQELKLNCNKHVSKIL